MQLKLEKK
jgi:hypothetical protein